MEVEKQSEKRMPHEYEEVVDHHPDHLVSAILSQLGIRLRQSLLADGVLNLHLGSSVTPMTDCKMI
jgi:hypothetical protein